ncbi:hypothetical protein Bca4012_033515 [Brassica carinata]
MVVELRSVIWAMRSLRVPEVVIASDYLEIVEALNSPHQRPLFRALLEQAGGKLLGVDILFLDSQVFLCTCVSATAKAMNHSLAHQLTTQTQKRYQFIRLHSKIYLKTEGWSCL